MTISRVCVNEWLNGPMALTDTSGKRLPPPPALWLKMVPRLVLFTSIPVFRERFLACTRYGPGIVLLLKDHNEGAFAGMQLNMLKKAKAAVLLHHRFDGT